MTGWLRRLWRRVTVADVEAGHARVRAAADRLADVLVDPQQHFADAIRTAPCEPTRAPDHVARAATNRANRYRALGEDPDVDWGPYINPYDDAA